MFILVFLHLVLGWCRVQLESFSVKPSSAAGAAIKVNAGGLASLATAVTAQNEVRRRQQIMGFQL